MAEESLDELLLERSWRKCFPDWDKATVDELVDAFDYFCRTYVRIRVPGKRILFELFPAQKEAVRDWLSHRQTLSLKARQIGFSTVVSIFALWVVMGGESRTVLMISKKEEDASKLLRHARMAYAGLPEWFKMRSPFRVDNNTKKLSFANDSWIDSLPSASDPARGETAFVTIVDEIGKLPNSEEAWASIEPTIDVGGRVIMLGTANGIDNLLYTLWEGAKNKTNSFKTIFFSWRSRSDRDDAWYEAKKFEFQSRPWILHQEYPDNPDEAFIRSGRMVFNGDVLDKIEPVHPYAVGALLCDGPKGPFTFMPVDDGLLTIWDFPRPHQTYVIGVDVAEGLEHGDFSSVHIIDARQEGVIKHRRVVATWHGHIDPDLLGSDVVAPLGWWYNNALVAIEVNNGGLVPLKAMQRVGYKNLYRQRRLGARKEDITDQLGWRTTKATKPVIIGHLNSELREGLELRCEHTLRELNTYVRDEHGRMSGSPHDDRVMSLAIANQMLNYVWLPEFRVDQTPPPGTFGHLVLQQRERAKPKRTVIGTYAARNAS